MSLKKNIFPTKNVKQKEILEIKQAIDELITNESLYFKTNLETLNKMIELKLIIKNLCRDMDNKFKEIKSNMDLLDNRISFLFRNLEL